MLEKYCQKTPCTACGASYVQLRALRRRDGGHDRKARAAQAASPLVVAAIPALLARRPPRQAVSGHRLPSGAATAVAAAAAGAARHSLGVHLRRR
ncbi:unnamed protein product [Closterium sp. NIES-54]